MPVWVCLSRIKMNHIDKIMISDECTGQNRNQYAATGCLHMLEECHTLQVIDHKSLESGHTPMECDLMYYASAK